MKRQILTALLVAVHQSAFAADCGKSLTAFDLQKLSAALEQAVQTFSRDSDTLLSQEIVSGLASPSSLFEIQRLQDVRVTADQVQVAAERLATLAQLRELMRDRMDRELIEQLLSLSAVNAAAGSKSALSRIGDDVPLLTHPGPASAVTRIRALVKEVNRIVAGCELPATAR